MMLLAPLPNWRTSGWLCGGTLASGVWRSPNGDLDPLLLCNGKVNILHGSNLKGIPAEGVSFYFFLAVCAVYGSCEPTDDHPDRVASSFTAALHRVAALARLEQGFLASVRINHITQAMAMVVLGHANCKGIVQDIYNERTSTVCCGSQVFRRHHKKIVRRCTPSVYLTTAIYEREALMNAGCTFPAPAVIAVWTELLFAYQKLHAAKDTIWRCFARYKLSPEYLFHPVLGKRRRLAVNIDDTYNSMHKQ